jgi:hypothetical protein
MDPAQTRLGRERCDIAKSEFGKINAPGINSGGAGNEGVGEHVRTRFHLG